MRETRNSRHCRSNFVQRYAANTIAESRYGCHGVFSSLCVLVDGVLCAQCIRRDNTNVIEVKRKHPTAATVWPLSTALCSEHMDVNDGGVNALVCARHRQRCTHRFRRVDCPYAVLGDDILLDKILHIQ